MNTGLGNRVSSKPRLPTVVPRVVSFTETPMTTASVNKLFTRIWPNWAFLANSASRWSGCMLSDIVENNRLSVSVTVRPGSCR
jgi:hypothetical protein